MSLPLVQAVAVQPDVIVACQNGDRVAFRQLFEAYRTRVYATARHILGRDAAAKDVTQQVFLAIWQHIGRFDPAAGELSTWIYRVTVNACLNERRRWVRLSPEEPPDVAADGRQEEAVLARQVQDALGHVSAKLRVPLVLRYVDGLSYDEIARVLGCTIGTVCSRLSRGQAALAKVIGKP